MNFVVGALVDFCRNRFATVERPAKGSVIGFCLRHGSNWRIMFFGNFRRPVLGSLTKVTVAVLLYLLVIQFLWQFKIQKLHTPQLFCMLLGKVSALYGHHV